MLFKDVDSAEELLHHPAFLRLVADCQGWASELKDVLAERAPADRMDDARQNAMRGRIEIYEDIAGIAEDLKIWKETLAGGE